MYGFKGRGLHRGPGLHVAEKPCARSFLECSSSRFAVPASLVAFVIATAELSLCAARITLYQPASSGWSSENYASSAWLSHLHQQVATVLDRSAAFQTAWRAKYPQSLPRRHTEVFPDRSANHVWSAIITCTIYGGFCFFAGVETACRHLVSS
jgi:hypothetical protein